MDPAPASYDILFSRCLKISHGWSKDFILNFCSKQVTGDIFISTEDFSTHISPPE
jgi:hypothetical protein